VLLAIPACLTLGASVVTQAPQNLPALFPRTEFRGRCGAVLASQGRTSSGASTGRNGCRAGSCLAEELTCLNLSRSRARSPQLKGKRLKTWLLGVRRPPSRFERSAGVRTFAAVLRDSHRNRFQSIDAARFTDERPDLTSTSYRDRYGHA